MELCWQECALIVLVPIVIAGCILHYKVNVTGEDE